MAISPVFSTFLAVEIVFALTAVLMIVASIIWIRERSNPNLENIARSILLNDFPLSATIANGAMVIATFLLILPAIAIPTSTTWLKIHGWLVVVCAIFTLCLGLNEWLQTLRTRAQLSIIWGQQTVAMQSMLQQKFNCCGYLNHTTPRYATDTVCPNDLIAASKLGCVGPFSEYAESWLNLVFTVAFGIVGINAVVLLSTAMMVKVRKEMLRYRRIDEKRGIRAI